MTAQNPGLSMEALPTAQALHVTLQEETKFVNALSTEWFTPDKHISQIFWGKKGQRNNT